MLLSCVPRSGCLLLPSSFQPHVAHITVLRLYCPHFCIWSNRDVKSLLTLLTLSSFDWSYLNRMRKVLTLHYRATVIHFIMLRAPYWTGMQVKIWNHCEAFSRERHGLPVVSDSEEFGLWSDLFCWTFSVTLWWLGCNEYEDYIIGDFFLFLVGRFRRALLNQGCTLEFPREILKILMPESHPQVFI